MFLFGVPAELVMPLLILTRLYCLKDLSDSRCFQNYLIIFLFITFFL